MSTQVLLCKKNTKALIPGASSFCFLGLSQTQFPLFVPDSLIAYPIKIHKFHVNYSNNTSQEYQSARGCSVKSPITLCLIQQQIVWHYLTFLKLFGYLHLSRNHGFFVICTISTIISIRWISVRIRGRENKCERNSPKICNLWKWSFTNMTRKLWENSTERNGLIKLRFWVNALRFR